MDTREQNRAAARRLHSAVVDRAAVLGLSLRQVAAELHMSGSTLTRLQGGHMPTWAPTVRLMRWAGLRLADLSPPEMGTEAELGLRVRRLCQAALDLSKPKIEESVAVALAADLVEQVLATESEHLTVHVDVRLYPGDAKKSRMALAAEKPLWRKRLEFPHLLREPE